MIKVVGNEISQLYWVKFPIWPILLMIDNNCKNRAVSSIYTGIVEVTLKLVIIKIVGNRIEASFKKVEQD